MAEGGHSPTSSCECAMVHQLEVHPAVSACLWPWGQVVIMWGQISIILGLVLAGMLRQMDSDAQEASSRPGVLLAFIILDNPAASVLDMQAVSFAGGQPTFSKYLDSFPFPFYIILRDLAALPATLASLLRRWVELTAAGALS